MSHPIEKVAGMHTLLAGMGRSFFSRRTNDLLLTLCARHPRQVDAIVGLVREVTGARMYAFYTAPEGQALRQRGLLARVRGFFTMWQRSGKPGHTIRRWYIRCGRMCTASIPADAVQPIPVPKAETLQRARLHAMQQPVCTV